MRNRQIQEMIRTQMSNKKLELYVHIPFCVKKCDYCDFLSGPAGESTMKAYTGALLAEMEGVRAAGTGAGHEIVSLFIGGGTPSLLDASDMERILETLRKLFSFSPDAEITIEANPGTLTAEKLNRYRKAGINRLSLGLQSADDRELEALGRIHTFRQFLESFRLAREAGFMNLNVDLMSAIPGQTCESWISSLRTVAGLEPEHISAYSLIVEPGTPFAERELELPDEETEYRMYEDTAAVLKEYGYGQYEISNYARKGYACRHNTGYWKRTEYLGLGLGASSLFEESRFRNTRNMEIYLKHSSDPWRIRREHTPLTVKDRQEEFMFLGLRMTAGISRAEFRHSFGKSPEEIYGEVLEKYRKMGFLEQNGDFWRFTRKGIHVSNHILAEFLQD